MHIMRFFTRPSTSVLMVCTANICRSPMAEGFLRAELKQNGLERQIRVDSAGTHASQPGRAADARAQKVCSRAGIDIRKSRARQVRDADFGKFDFILAMDRKNYEWLLAASPEPYRNRISLLGAWTEGGGQETEIPDPYYGNITGFESVLSLLRAPLLQFLTQFTTH